VRASTARSTASRQPGPIRSPAIRSPTRRHR
jgi:hypothetical protein